MHATHTTRMSFGGATKTDDPHRLAVHMYTIAVSQRDPAPSEVTEIKPALAALVAQLAGRQLEVMLPGASPTPAGIAAWTIEQLALRFPRVVAVTVHEDDDEVTVEREVQR